MGFDHLVRRSRSYSSFGVHGVQPQSVTVLTDGEPRQVDLLTVSRGFWTTLGIEPTLGRIFTPEEDPPGEPLMALLSEAFWVEHFGRDPDAVGSTLELNGFPVEVIGIAPASLQYPFPSVDIYVSARVDRDSKVLAHFFYVVARLRNGTTQADADRELEALLPSLAEVGYPPDFVERLFTGTGDVPTLREHFVGPVRVPLLTLFGVTGLVLLIGCVNVANLLLVRGSERMGQGAVRRALGARPWEIARYVLAESVVLAVGGGVLGALLAWLGVEGLVALRPASIPRLDQVATISARVLGFCVGVSLAAVLLFGSMPAVRMRAVRAVDVVRGGASTKGGRSSRRLHQLLVVTEIALALIVLVGSILLVRSTQAIDQVPKGFHSEGRLVFRTSTVAAGITTPPAVVQHHEEVLRALRAIPGVEGAATISALPLSPEGLAQQPINPIQDHVSQEGETISRRIRAVSSGYFEAMGIPLLAGRDFGADDHATSAPVAIVSRSMADEFWPGRDPMGLTILDSIRVVGVVGDVKDERLTDAEPPIAYFPLWSPPWGANLSGQMYYVVQTVGAPEDMIPAVREEMRRAAPGIPMYKVSTMEDMVGASIDTHTFAGRLMALAAALALFLGAVGIYAVLAYSVRLRQGEIGLRMALGASAPEAGGLVVRSGLSTAAVGVGLGLVGAAASARVLGALLYGVTPYDPTTYAIAVGIFTLVAATACVIPAARAARVSPAVALRAE